MNQEIDLCIQSSMCKCPIERWEILKSRIKKKSIEFARNKTSEQSLIISQLSERVNELEANLPLNKTEDELLQETKNDLEEKLYDKVKGMIFRSKARWYEQGEKNTKYFFSLEKSRYNAKTCF